MRKFTLVCLSLAVTAAALVVHDGRAAADAADRGTAHARKFDLSTLRPEAARAAASAVSPPVSSFKPPETSGQKFVPSRRLEIGAGVDLVREFSGAPPRPGAEGVGSLAAFTPVPMPAPSLSFDGLANYDNIDLYNLLILPPDMNGDVGPGHYVQAVNAALRIYDKSGRPVTPAFKISDLFAQLNTTCSRRSDGLPIVLYDPLADRWMISQYCIAFPPFRQLIAISKTGDPTGQYYLYEFVMPNVKLNDFSKFGVWSDAYYMSTEEYFGSDYVSSGLFAFDRGKMLRGDPSAGYVYFSIPSSYPQRLGGVLPADLDGMTPPRAGTPGLFVGYTADEYGDAADAVRLFDLSVDFATPANSTLTERPESPLAVAPFDPTSPPGRTDILQPSPGAPLDSGSDRLMYRAAYRNFGTWEALVFNQTVRTSPPGEPYRAGVRLYELRRTGASFAVHEHSTIGNTSSSRWVASAAQDRDGNLAVQYNMVTDEKEPSILYTGRLAGDAPGMLRSEGELVAGSGVQKGFGWRWGDYSGMSVDPADDCTFWLTGEYYTQESEDFSDYTWLTRIGRFKFSECTPAPRGRLVVSLIDDATGRAIDNSPVELYRGGDLASVPFVRYTRTQQPTETMLIPPGQYTIVGRARGYGSASAAVTVADGGPQQTIELRLRPVPVIENAAVTFSAESCAIDQTAEPGETVTVNVPLRNTGAGAATSLVATLERTGGVIAVGPPQNYGALTAGGPAVTRPFSFTVSPTVRCGDPVTLRLTLTDNGEPVGRVEIRLESGAVRYALRESFDRVAAGRLPEGWASSATGAQQLWRVSSARRDSAPNSIFSPDPNQVGLNELTTPIFRVSTANARLTFRNWYELETTFLRNRLYDGSVLEIRIGDGGQWQDILAAGGAFESGGYDGTIDSCCSNPLGGRLGWSGRSGVNETSEFITTAVRLPASAAGQNVQLRWRVGTDVGTFREGQYLDDVAVADGYSCSCPGVRGGGRKFDLDGDGKTDLSVFRPTDAPNAPDFVIERSSDGAVLPVAWGSAGDRVAAADYDGDARTDIAVFRPSTSVWYILRSSDSTMAAAAFGLATDRTVPADYDGDGRADLAVWRPSDGAWYVLKSSDASIETRRFGLDGDIPLPDDFDGDGRADAAVYRPSSGVWYVSRSSDRAVTFRQFGISGDQPVPGDHDGDGRADIAVFRPSTGTWYLLRSKLGFGGAQLGVSGDRPLQGDFDGDGIYDIAVYRPSTSTWFWIPSSDGSTRTRVFGSTGDIPVPGSFVAEQSAASR
ncbi:MAG: FG-GAP-like repeat-containing protein [Pyrinomonadaceae bacterium]